MSEKKYVNGIFIKEKVFNDGGTLLNVALSESLLSEMIVNIKKGYCRIVIAKRKEADKFGNTHYAYYDTYEPKTAETAQEIPPDLNFNPPGQKAFTQKDIFTPGGNEDLPF